eukprot:2263607-Prymnesium_polylepis.1
MKTLTPGSASGPKWPCPGMSSKWDREMRENLRCGPMKHSALFVAPCQHHTQQDEIFSSYAS